RNRNNQTAGFDGCRHGCCRAYYRRFRTFHGHHGGGSVMAKLSKRAKAFAAKVDRTKAYPFDNAVALIKECATAKFDESIDISVQLGVDAKKSDQVVRGSVVLPAGTGKSVRVAVFATGEKAEQAKAA